MFPPLISGAGALGVIGPVVTKSLLHLYAYKKEEKSIVIPGRN